MFQNALAKSLALADEIIVANVFKSDSIAEAERLDLHTLVADLEKLGPRARVVPEVEEIVKIVAPEMRSGDVVAILSNGGFGGIYEKLPQQLRSQSEISAKAAANSASSKAEG